MELERVQNAATPANAVTGPSPRTKPELKQQHDEMGGRQAERAAAKLVPKSAAAAAATAAAAPDDPQSKLESEHNHVDKSAANGRHLAPLIGYEQFVEFLQLVAVQHDEQHE